MNFSFNKYLKKVLSKTEFWIILGSFLIAFYAYYPSLFNKYLIADDIRATSYWIPQFKNPELFKGDDATNFYKSICGWGFASIYILGSLLINPIYLSTIFSILIVVFCAYFIFKIIRNFSDSFSAILGALGFCASSHILGSIAGATPRSFGYLFLLMFLFYFCQKKYLLSSVALILQCLFYPIVVFSSLLVFSFSVLFNKDFLNFKSIKLKYLIISIVMCAALLSTKHIFLNNELSRQTYTIEEMQDLPQFYKGIGRVQLLPRDTWLNVLEPELRAANFLIYSTSIWLKKIFPQYLQKYSSYLIFYLSILLVIFACFRLNHPFPIELIYLPFASIIMFIIAEI